MFGWESWMWLGIIILAIFCEAQTAALVAIWFMPAALVSMVLSFFDVYLWVQVLAFFAISIAGIILFKKVFNKKLKATEESKTNVDAIIGKKCIVVEEISNIHAKGAVKLGGQVWSARSSDESVIEEGKIVTVESISGVKLICKEEK